MPGARAFQDDHTYEWYNRPAPAAMAGKRCAFTYNGRHYGRWYSNGYRYVPDNADRRVLAGYMAEPYEFPADLNENVGLDVLVPGGMLQCGHVEASALWDFTGSTNSKTLRISLQDAYYSATDCWVMSTARNGALEKSFQPPVVQIGCDGCELHLNYFPSGNASGVGAGGALAQANLDTSYDFKVQFRAQKAVATETIRLRRAAPRCGW